MPDLATLNASLATAVSLAPKLLTADEQRAIHAARWRLAVARRTVRP